jgi:uncharacterized repeat protein (TIGR01451 family)
VCNVGTLASGAAATFTVQVTMPATPGVVSNTATASATETDPNPANNSATAITTVGSPSADLAITKTAAAGPYVSGASLQYTITVSNAGPQAATNVVVTDVLPAGTAFVSATPTQGTCTGTTTVTCSLGTIANAANATITLTLTLPSVAGSVSNTASVAASESDPNPANNAAISTITTVVVSKSFTGPTATGSGTATATFTGGGVTCGFTKSVFIPVTGGVGSPPAPPSGTWSFPQGLFDFALANCTPGSTMTFTITYPQPIPAGAVYWKYGPTAADPAQHWYQLAATFVGNTVTFSVVDGGLGDDDLAVNGTVVDQGGPGVPIAGGGAAAIPTLGEWALIVLAMLMMLIGIAGIRRAGQPGRGSSTTSSA